VNDLIRKQFRVAACVLMGLASVTGPAQDSGATSSNPSLGDAIRQLQSQIQLLQVAVQEIKQESEHYRTEALALKRELASTRRELDAVSRKASAAPGGQLSPQEARAEDRAPEQASLDKRVDKLEEEQQLLDSRVAEQYQTKVESVSKYRVRLSGLLLFNLFSNTGNVDHMEVPAVVLAANPSQSGNTSGGAFGATFRQSQLGLEVYGPAIAGAKTRGDFVADFFGEFPETNNGSTAGSFRLRTGTLRFDWARTSLVGGMDSIFFSPTYPTSFASVGIPPLSYSGNLWAWLPQLRVEHRWATSDASTLILSGGIFDPLTGETPPNEFLRIAGAGENSRQPGYGTRLEWKHKIASQSLILGLGGAYNRENWGFDRNINGWVANADWDIPLGSRLRASGKFYLGRAIGGLGAGVGRSVVFSFPSTCPVSSPALSCPATRVTGLGSTGGWAQLKYKLAARVELNAAGGQDGAAADDIRAFSPSFAPGYFAANITRNRSEFANIIYRPRSNLLFSTEFRALRTFTIDGSSVRANQLNLIMGMFF
jgi:hypothetical protein